MQVKSGYAETMGRPGHEQAPDTVCGFRNVIQRPRMISFEPTHPVPQGHGVVLTQALDIADFESMLFGGLRREEFVQQIPRDLN